MDISKKNQLLTIAQDVAKTVGSALHKYRAHTVKDWDKDIKIDADIKAHDTALQLLEITGIPVLSEEDDSHNFEHSLMWILDPLDGSINFLRGIPFHSVSIGLYSDGEPVLGVVYDFSRDEMFSGIVDVGAWLNGESIRVTTVHEKNKAILMTGFPSHTDYSKEALEHYIDKIQSFKKVRLIGSAALSLAYVASGRADAYYEKDIKIWDVAAGLALVKSAGGVYIQTPISADGACEIMASNGHIDIL